MNLLARCKDDLPGEHRLHDSHPIHCGDYKSLRSPVHLSPTSPNSPTTPFTPHTDHVQVPDLARVLGPPRRKLPDAPMLRANERLTHPASQASAAYPENTLASFEAAMRDGAEGIESGICLARSRRPC